MFEKEDALRVASKVLAKFIFNSELSEEFRNANDSSRTGPDSKNRTCGVAM